MSFTEILIIYFIFRTGTIVLFSAIFIHMPTKTGHFSVFCLHYIFSFPLTLYLKVHFGTFPAGEK